MVIGIIGAGISGLTAGRLLARAGHEVTIFEKSKGYGGRMATRYAGDGLSAKLDHGINYFTAELPHFKQFTVELLEQGLIQQWGKHFAGFDGESLLVKDPNIPAVNYYTSVDGMNRIGKYLSRWVDVRNNTLVGGLTHIGSNRTKKRTWMINLTTSEVVGVDAVIIALPAPQAYGILSTTTDEINTLKVVRQIDEVHYNAAYSLMAGYGKTELPGWDGILCRNSILDYISNEASKRNGQECTFVLQASDHFTKANRKMDADTVKKLMLTEFAKITGGWSTNPDWHQLHFWRYSRPQKILDQPYIIHEDEDSPLALTGDYFEGNTIEHAYQSGYLLARHWIEKYQ
jgi:renalase